ARASVRRSARQVVWALCSKLAVQHTSGLADFDEVSVRIPHIAADLSAAVDRRRDELRSLCLPLLIAHLDVSDPQVQEDRGGVAGFIIDHGDVGFIWSRWPTRVHEDPRIGQLDDARILAEDDRPAENTRIEIPRAGDLAHGDEQG